jgi:hypothetical protein
MSASATSAAARPAGGAARGEHGQAAVELVALAPLVAVLITALVVAVQAHRARATAMLASHAGAVAALVGRDPIAAAREAAPGIDPGRLQVRRDGRRITVRVRAEGPRTLVRTFDAAETVTLPPEVSP